MLFFKKRKKRLNEGEDRIVVKENSMSSKADGYNRLKDNILYINADGKNKVIQIESSVSHEGKTTVACNLAVSLGLTDKKVVVVDLDFRKPRVQQRLGLTIDNGISEYMLGEQTLEQIIKTSKYKNVDVVTRGAKIYNSSLVLVSEKFKKFIGELRDRYDYVILDCAPVLQVSDYIHISQVSDGVLFLVAYGSTTRNQVSDAVKELKKNGANLLGTVFSMYDRKKDRGYDYYGKGYYGKSYYQAYIEDEEVKETKSNEKLEQALSEVNTGADDDTHDVEIGKEE
ncbi:MAG: CpsD/CapB family tyrosine-protein kinase [Clostridiales bacterium]|nr:CpsD/CapB family tyrosine-protein kinase [Clostridiales bacterium]